MSRNVLLAGEAEEDLTKLGFDNTQEAHTLQLAERLSDFGNEEEITDLEIKKLNHFYEVRQLLDFGGALRSRELQIRFGIVEKSNGEVVILQITDTLDDPDSIEMVVLEHRYRSYLVDGSARVLVTANRS